VGASGLGGQEQGAFSLGGEAWEEAEEGDAEEGVCRRTAPRTPHSRGREGLMPWQRTQGQQGSGPFAFAGTQEQEQGCWGPTCWQQQHPSAAPPHPTAARHLAAPAALGGRGEVKSEGLAQQGAGEELGKFSGGERILVTL